MSKFPIWAGHHHALPETDSLSKHRLKLGGAR
jgi:hypothetical protein